MSQLVDVLRSLWFTPLANIEGFRRDRLADWLCGGKYQCVGGRSKDSFEFVWFNESDIAVAFAGDADRFTSAALESLIFAYYSQGKGVSDGHSWKYISLYYAAYFAALSLLKCCGRSVSFIDGQELQALQQVVNQSWPHLGTPPKLSPGTYDLVIDQKAQVLLVDKSRVGRAHSAMWKSFSKLISDLDERLNAFGGAEVLPVASDQLRRLRFHLGGGSARNSVGDTLSSIRNAINYRQEYGVWFPRSRSNSLSKMDRAELSKTISDCDAVSLPETSVTKDQAYCDVSKFLVSFCFENARELAYRGKGAKSFVNKGCLRFASEQELS